MEIGSTPSMSTILGGSNNNHAIINKINETWAGQGGVVFGKVGDPFKDRYLQFKNVVSNVIRDTTNLIKNTYDYIMGDNRIVRVDCVDALNAIPAVMQPHILTYAPIREMFVQEQIYGWGIKPDQLPEEDVVGRLINNGTVTETFEDGKFTTPDVMEWVWNCSDPIMSIEELDDLDASRLFIDTFIQSQMTIGTNEDPTDYNDGGLIGDLK